MASPESQRFESHRFSEYTPTDHQAPLWVTTSITLTYAGLFLCVRFAIKYKFLGIDDVLLGVAHIFGVAQWAMMFAALHDGVGKLLTSSNESPLATAAKLVFASKIVLLFSIGLSKCSVILFLRQLFTRANENAWNVCTAVLIGTTIWTVISVLAVSVRCDSEGALQGESMAQCPVVTGLDVCLEALLLIIPAYFFSPIQISLSRKITVLGAFFVRVGVPAIFIAYLQAYVHFRKHGRPSLDAIDALVWQQALCGYSLISATAPCLKSFLGRFRTDDLLNLSMYTNSQMPTHSQGYAMEPLTSRDGGVPACHDASGPPDFHASGVQNSVVAHVESGGDEGSMRSFGSRQIMIHRKVDYEVYSTTT